MGERAGPLNWIADMTKISVVIATYNRASLLEPTLDQLSRQAYEPGDEVIVVDNGSTDATPQVVARAAQGFPVRLRSMHEATNGKGPALNAGIAAAGGSILALTDDDVLVANDWIATIRDIFSDPSIALVGGRVDPNWERPAPAWLSIERHGHFTVMASPLGIQNYGPSAQPLGERTAIGANMVVRRTVCEHVGGISALLAPQSGRLIRAEDHEFCVRVRAAGYRCEYHPRLQVRHWVPAARTNFGYFVRWFFWSGVAHAIIGSDDPRRQDGSRRPIPYYFVKCFFRTSLSAVYEYARGRKANAAAAATRAAYALGYVAHHKARWSLSQPKRTATAVSAPSPT
jgi:glucosyl-dolichyl phosphate glucuronosyltransferase